jgi:hypothetical protein
MKSSFPTAQARFVRLPAPSRLPKLKIPTSTITGKRSMGKYLIAWVLGVPAIVLVVFAIFFR